MADSRETPLMTAFVAGYPIKHSRSPLIHNYWLRQLHIAGSYEAREVAPEEFADFLSKLKSGESGYRGGNVTIPHKENAYRLADRRDQICEELGASNTLWMEDGLLHATNTDGAGFVTNLDQWSPNWDRCETAVILGAGGASRAVVQAVRNRGVKTIYLVNRTVERAKELADRFGPAVQACAMPQLKEVMTGAGLFVNTTSLGMDGQPAPNLPFDQLAKDAIVTDIVYTPLITPILQQARDHGLKTVDGLGMLLHQARPGFEKWFGTMPDVTTDLRNLIMQDLGLH